jgi:hypothetical protein
MSGSPSPQVLWFVLGISVLAIGAAFMIASFFLYALGAFGGGNFAGALGFWMAAIGASTAVGSLLTFRRDPEASPATELRSR